MFDSLKFFSLEPKPMSIFEAIVVPVASFIVISFLKNTWCVISTIIKKVFTVYMPQLIEIMKEKRRYRQFLKERKISENVYEQLLIKKRSGQRLSRIERKAMAGATDEVKKEGEMLADINSLFNEDIGAKEK